jgi:hypothetical protein
MSRDPFIVNIGGISRVEWPGSPPTSYFVFDAKRSQEAAIGLPRRKPKGWLEPRSYSFFYKTYQRAYGQYYYFHNPANPTSWYRWTGFLGDQPQGQFNSLNHFDQITPEGSIYDPTLSNSALISALLQLKAGKVNLGVAYAERSQTARLLGDTTRQLARSFTQLKRGNVRKAMQELGIANKTKFPPGNSVPQKWLGLQYGWKPLLSDIYGSVAALEQRPKDDWRVTVKSKKKSEEIWLTTYSIDDAGSGVARSERSNFTRIDALPGNELLGSLASLGITNPLLIAWELVPYSFVVDWVFPVGSWLDSLDSWLGYDSAYVSSSTLTRCEWTGKGKHTELNNGFGGFIDADYLETKRIVSLERVATVGMPLPTFPRIKDPRSLSHAASGLSLLASAFGRSRYNH